MLEQEPTGKHFGECSSIFFLYQEEREITLHWEEMRKETARAILDSDSANH